MRTLDEVIEAERHCIGIGCQGCPYDIVKYGGSCECNEDVLYYLKEYKIKRERIMAKAQDCEDAEKRLQDEINRYQEAVKEYEEILTDYVVLKQYWAEQQANPALTWDELRTMEGKPVWVESNIIGGRWMLYKGENRFSAYSTGFPEAVFANPSKGGSVFAVKNLGITWQAYRKEHHE